MNLASRIQAAAEPNQILVSEEMTRCLPVKACGQRASYQLKGIL